MTFEWSVRQPLFEELEIRSLLSVTFVDSGQMLGFTVYGARDMSLGDLDGDGDLDAFLTSVNQER